MRTVRQRGYPTRKARDGQEGARGRERIGRSLTRGGIRGIMGTCDLISVKDRALPRKPISSLLIKPAGPDCNLGCHYCFYVCKDEVFDGSGPHRMSEDILEEVTRQAIRDSGPTVTFCWQGGEPTLMGVDFYRRAVELQKRYARPGKVVENALQTNGWVINDEWAEFLRKNDFLVGLSLDGPDSVHDKYRRTRNGRPTHEGVVGAAKLLLDAGVATNALVVITEHSAQHGREIYEYLRELEFKFMQFIPCLPIPEDAPADGPRPASPKSFAKFMIDTFDCWREDFRDGWPTVSIRHLETLFSSCVGGPPLECTLSETCGDYVVVEHNGDVFSCDFYVEPEWRLGNVMEGSLVKMLNSERQNEFGRRKQLVQEECHSCRWLSRCRGGCPADRKMTADGLGAMRLCQGYKLFLEHADGAMRALAKRWLARQAQHDQVAAKRRRSAPGRPVGRNDPCPCGSGRKYKKCCGKLSP